MFRMCTYQKKLIPHPGCDWEQLHLLYNCPFFHIWLILKIPSKWCFVMLHTAKQKNQQRWSHNIRRCRRRRSYLSKIYNICVASNGHYITKIIRWKDGPVCRTEICNPIRGYVHIKSTSASYLKNIHIIIGDFRCHFTTNVVFIESTNYDYMVSFHRWSRTKIRW